MRFHPTRIHAIFLCLYFISFSLIYSCTKDRDLILDAVLNDPNPTMNEEQTAEEEDSETEEETTEEEAEGSSEEEQASEEEESGMEEGFESRITRFPTINDAHLQSGQGFNQNIIRLQENWRTSYLMFDLSQIDSIGAYITDARLEFTINSDDGNGEINVFSGNSSDWSEDNLSQQTAPQAELQLGTLIKEYNVGNTEAIQLSGSDLIAEVTTLILDHKDGNDLAFASKEHPSVAGPQLVVTYNAPQDAEEIVIEEEEEQGTGGDNGGGDNGGGEETNEEETNEGPMAVADASPSAGGVPLEVSFTGGNSSDDNGITAYSWDFKDGSTASTANPSHTFTQVGTYQVELTVRDAEGLTDTDVVTIEVNEEQNEGPIARVSANPTSGEAPLDVSFRGSDSTDDHSVASYSWDFKDGSTSNQANPDHTFTDPGTYQVELTVRDENGLSDKETVTITVEEKQNEAPNAVASANPRSGTAPLEVQFTGNQSTDDTEVTGYSWDFKDGSTTTNTNPSHTFTDPGTYAVELTVRDADGLTDTASVTITVTAPQQNEAPNAVASSDRTSGDAPLTVQFRGDQSTDDNGIVAYSWNFDDGSSSGNANPSHTFNNPGNYSVQLTVRDGGNLTSTATLNITVNQPSSGGGGNAPDGSYYVTVNGSSSNDGLSEANAWSIQHAFANAQAGDHVYIKAGNYGAVELQPVNSGNSGNPIRFIGYRNTPGDVVANNGSTFNYGETVDASRMPLLKGNRVNKKGQGTGIFSFVPYVEFSNIQITHYKSGIFTSGVHNVLDNIIVTEVGDLGTTAYEGVGITVNGDYSVIKNSIVINSAAEGFRFKGCKYQQHSYNKVYCDYDFNACDYYYLLLEGANDNEVDNVYVERVGDLSHSGHGIVLKFQAERNRITNSTVKNCWFEFSYSGVKNNQIINSRAIGGPERQGNILIANGANNNYFENCTIADNDGVCFSDWDEDFSRGDVRNAGHNNTFYRCEIKRTLAGVNFWWWSQANRDAEAHDNVFDQCTFTDVQNLFHIDRENYNNTIKNSTITNVPNLKGHYYPTVNEGIQLRAVFENNTLINCGFQID